MQRHLRLRRKADFARMRQAGRVRRHRFFVLSAAPNDLPHNRYGFVTSKHLGTAVARNRVRRVLREAVRLLHPNLATGHDMVFIARKPMVGQPFSEVKAALTAVFRQTGLWAVPAGDETP